MLDMHLLAADSDEIIGKLNRRNKGDMRKPVEALLLLEEERKKIQQEREALAIQSKTYAEKMKEALAAGDTERLKILKKEVKKHKIAYKDKVSQLRKQQSACKEANLLLPNIPDDRVRTGKERYESDLIGKHKTHVQPIDNIPHWKIATSQDWIDFDQGSKVTAAGFPFYKGWGATLQRALIQFFIDSAVESGYDEVQPPLLVNATSAMATGQLPDKEGLMYQLAKNKLYLIPTAEVPITNMYRGQLLTEKQLPIRHVAYSPCFRREAGSWGRKVRGLNRLHQFDKVELVEFLPDAEREHQAFLNMVEHVEWVLDKLDLTYRVVGLCSGELGFAAAMTYDIDVWSPGQQAWLEVSSISKFGTYQSRRMKLRYVGSDGNKHFVHTINGSGLALPRVLAALLETGHTKDGMRLPYALLRYIGLETIPYSAPI